jgi:hypothetical protein
VTNVKQRRSKATASCVSYPGTIEKELAMHAAVPIAILPLVESQAGRLSEG